MYTGPTPTIRLVIYAQQLHRVPRKEESYSLRREERGMLDERGSSKTFGLTNFPISRINMLIQLVVFDGAARARVRVVSSSF